MKQLIFILSMILIFSVGCAKNLKSINQAGNISFSIDKKSDGGYIITYGSGKEMSELEIEFEMKGETVKVKFRAKDIRAFAGIKEAVKVIEKEIESYGKLIEAGSKIIPN